jgi:hypothetical protein
VTSDWCSTHTHKLQSELVLTGGDWHWCALVLALQKTACDWLVAVQSGFGKMSQICKLVMVTVTPKRGKKRTRPDLKAL